MAPKLAIELLGHREFPTARQHLKANGQRRDLLDARQLASLVCLHRCQRVTQRMALVLRIGQQRGNTCVQIAVVTDHGRPMTANRDVQSSLNASANSPTRSLIWSKYPFTDTSRPRPWAASSVSKISMTALTLLVFR